MKKMIRLFVLAAIAIISIPLCMYAQDTTLIHGAGAGLLKTVVGGFATQYPIVGLVGTGLFVVSEVLAGIPRVKANSVFQVLSELVRSLFGK